MEIEINTIKHKRILNIFIIAFAFLLFGNTLNNSYNLDDELVTKNHRHTSKGFSAIPDIFTSPYYEDEYGYAYEYRPITLTSFAIEHQFFGESPGISHFINVLLYALTGIMLWTLLSILFQNMNSFLTLLITLLFIAHPLHTEVVANIKNRDEILALLFVLVSWFFAYKSTKEKIIQNSTLAILFFVVAILSKQSILLSGFLIPVSLIFFSKSSKKHILVLSILFGAILFILSPLNSFTNKALLFISVAGIPTLIHFLYTKTNDPSFSFKSLFFTNIRDEQKDTCHFFNFPLSETITIFFSVISVIVCSWACVYDRHEIALIIILILTTAYLILSENSRKFVLLSLALSVSVTSYFFNTGGIFTALYMISATIIIFDNERNLKWHLAVYFILFISGIFIINYAVITPLIVLALYYKSRNKKHFLFFALNYLISLIYILIKGKPFEYSSIIYGFIMLFIPFLVYNIKTRKIGYHLFFALFVSFLFFELYINDPTSTLANSTIQDISIEANILPNSNRPIDFVEMPVSLDAPLNIRLGTSAYILAEYLKLIFIPHPMSFYYGYAYIIPVGLNNSQAIFSIIIHLLLFIIAIYYFKKHPVLSFGILFYLISISVFSNIFHTVVGMMADRFTYTPTLGFCIAIGYILTIVFKVDNSPNISVRLKPAFIFFVIILLSAYSYQTISRNALWKNQLTLMTHDIKHLSNSAQANYLLAMNYMSFSNEKEYASQSAAMRNQAVYHFKKTLEIYPGMFNAYYNLGRAYIVLDKLDSTYYFFTKVNEMDSTLTDVTIKLAIIAEGKNDFKTAVKYYEQVLKFDPNYKEAYANLSYLYFRMKNPEASVRVNLRAMEHNPNWKEPYENIAKVYLFVGDTLTAQKYLNAMPR